MIDLNLNYHGLSSLDKIIKDYIESDLKTLPK